MISRDTYTIFVIVSCFSNQPIKVTHMMKFERGFGESFIATNSLASVVIAPYNEYPSGKTMYTLYTSTEGLRYIPPYYDKDDRSFGPFQDFDTARKFAETYIGVHMALGEKLA